MLKKLWIEFPKILAKALLSLFLWLLGLHSIVTSIIVSIFVAVLFVFIAAKKEDIPSCRTVYRFLANSFKKPRM